LLVLKNISIVMGEISTFEETLEKIKIGKFHYLLILICGCILTSSFLELSSVVSTFPISQCELQLTNIHKGVLSSIGYLGVIISSHFWGFMADTRGRKKILVLALFTSFFFTILSSLAKNFWMLLVCRFFNGVL
jgi:MFS transporter, VNT family, synaptic vesicle glycoprotein 2